MLLDTFLIDISNSFWFGLVSACPILSNSGVMYSIGTQATCEVQGFFVQVGCSGGIYSASLALYYVLTLRCGWKEEQVQSIEHWLHTVQLLWGFAAAIVGFPLKLYNNANLW